MRQTARPYPDRALRYPMMVPIHFRKRGTPQWLDGRTVNISRTGILFRTDESIPEKSILDIRVEFPTSSYLECQCTVVRTDLSLLAVQLRRPSLVHS